MGKRIRKLVSVLITVTFISTSTNLSYIPSSLNTYKDSLRSMSASLGTAGEVSKALIPPVRLGPTESNITNESVPPIKPSSAGQRGLLETLRAKMDIPKLMPEFGADINVDGTRSDRRYENEVERMLEQDFPNEPKDVKANLSRMYGHGALADTGKLFILPIDQGFEHTPGLSFAPNSPAADLEYQAMLADKMGMSAYVAHPGAIRTIAHKWAKQLPLIAKMNAGSSKGGRPKVRQHSALVGDVKEMAELGVAAVGFTIYPGSEEFNEQMEELRILIRVAKEHGLPTIVWSYPRGGSLTKEEETAVEVSMAAAHIALAAGAHIVKIKPPADFYNEKERDLFDKHRLKHETLTDRVKLVKHFGAFGGRRHLIFSGGVAKGDDAVLREIAEIELGGGDGHIVGRNMFQRPWEEATELGLKILAVIKAKVAEEKDADLTFANADELLAYALGDAAEKASSAGNVGVSRGITKFMSYRLLDRSFVEGRVGYVRFACDVPFNKKVSLKDPTRITDPTRIDVALSTLGHIVQEGGKVVFQPGWLKRPKGVVKELSVIPVFLYLREALLAEGIIKSRDEMILVPTDIETETVGSVHQNIDKIQATVQRELRDGNKVKIVCLENPRFDIEYDEGELRLMEEIREMVDYAVYDDFNQQHRPVPDIRDLPLHIPSFVGEHLTREIQTADELLKRLAQPKRKPFALYIGGKKIETRPGKVSKVTVALNLIKNGQMRNGDRLPIGGGVSYAFLVAAEYLDRIKIPLYAIVNRHEVEEITAEDIRTIIGDSYISDEALDTPEGLTEAHDRIYTFAELLIKAAAKGIKVKLPKDHIIREIESGSISVCKGRIPKGSYGIDIGPKTTEEYNKARRGISVGIIAGPMGIADDPDLPEGAKGTDVVLRGLQEENQQNGALTMTAGGETTFRANQIGALLTWLSVGGGALLEYIEQKGELNGLVALRESARRYGVAVSSTLISPTIYTFRGPKSSSAGQQHPIPKAIAELSAARTQKLLLTTNSTGNADLEGLEYTGEFFTPGKPAIRLAADNGKSFVSVKVSSYSLIEGQLKAAEALKCGIIFEISPSQLGHELDENTVVSYIEEVANDIGFGNPIIFHGNLQYTSSSPEERIAIEKAAERMIKAGVTSIGIDATAVIDEAAVEAAVMEYYSRHGSPAEQLVVELHRASALPLLWGAEFFKLNRENLSDLESYRDIYDEVKSDMKRRNRPDEEIEEMLGYLESTFDILFHKAGERIIPAVHVIEAYDNIMHEVAKVTIAGELSERVRATMTAEERERLLPTSSAKETLHQLWNIKALLLKHNPGLIGTLGIEVKVGQNRRFPNPRLGGKLEFKLTHPAAVRVMGECLKKEGFSFDLIATNNVPSYGIKYVLVGKTLKPVSEVSMISPWLTRELAEAAEEFDAFLAQHEIPGANIEDLSELFRAGVVKARAGVVKFSVDREYREIILNVLARWDTGLWHSPAAVLEYSREHMDKMMGGLNRETGRKIRGWAERFAENSASSVLVEEDSLFERIMKLTYALGVEEGKIQKRSTQEDIAVIFATEFGRVFSKMDESFYSLGHLHLTEKASSAGNVSNVEVAMHITPETELEDLMFMFDHAQGRPVVVINRPEYKDHLGGTTERANQQLKLFLKAGFEVIVAFGDFPVFYEGKDYLKAGIRKIPDTRHGIDALIKEREGIEGISKYYWRLLQLQDAAWDMERMDEEIFVNAYGDMPIVIKIDDEKHNLWDVLREGLVTLDKARAEVLKELSTEQEVLYEIDVLFNGVDKQYLDQMDLVYGPVGSIRGSIIPSKLAGYRRSYIEDAIAHKLDATESFIDLIYGGGVNLENIIELAEATYKGAFVSGASQIALADEGVEVTSNIAKKAMDFLGPLSLIIDTPSLWTPPNEQLRAYEESGIDLDLVRVIHAVNRIDSGPWQEAVRGEDVSSQFADRSVVAMRRQEKLAVTAQVGVGEYPEGAYCGSIPAAFLRKAGVGIILLPVGLGEAHIARIIEQTKEAGINYAIIRSEGYEGRITVRGDETDIAYSGQVQNVSSADDIRRLAAVPRRTRQEVSEVSVYNVPIERLRSVGDELFPIQKSSSAGRGGRHDVSSELAGVNRRLESAIESLLSIEDPNEITYDRVRGVDDIIGEETLILEKMIPRDAGDVATKAESLDKAQQLSRTMELPFELAGRVLEESEIEGLLTKLDRKIIGGILIDDEAEVMTPAQRALLLGLYGQGSPIHAALEKKLRAKIVLSSEYDAPVDRLDNMIAISNRDMEKAQGMMRIDVVMDDGINSFMPVGPNLVLAQHLLLYRLDGFDNTIIRERISDIYLAIAKQPLQPEIIEAFVKSPHVFTLKLPPTVPVDKAYYTILEKMSVYTLIAA